ncbi:MAG: NAD(P)-dependent oxidoreductase [Aigarchaeota archaeon]|nr:NAD(P)-dependent oxidoreductase [Aigarchaeota archaeon]
MLEVARRLRQLHEEGGEIVVGLVGAGKMGTLIASQTALMKGIRTALISDTVLERAMQAHRTAGVPEEKIAVVGGAEAADVAISEGMFVATRDAAVVSTAPSVQVVIDATGVPNVGAEVSSAAIENKKHVVMVNAEADATIGPILKKMADEGGVVYTGTAGDEPGAIMELYTFADALGMKTVVAGKGKNNPLRRDATPSSCASEAGRKGLSPRVLCSFVDGTKTMIEMTQVANATGLVPDIRGMHGPEATVSQLASVFKLSEDGGILNRTGVVDFAIGVAPGVFVVASTGSSEIRSSLEYLGLGPGPNYTFYRPFHLPGIETPFSVAYAALLGGATICPRGRQIADILAVAKKDLAPDQLIDGVGGFTVYGLIEKAGKVREADAPPIGILEGARVVKTIRKGSTVTYDLVELEEESAIVRLRRSQDKVLA